MARSSSGRQQETGAIASRLFLLVRGGLWAAATLSLLALLAFFALRSAQMLSLPPPGGVWGGAGAGVGAATCRRAATLQAYSALSLEFLGLPACFSGGLGDDAAACPGDALAWGAAALAAECVGAGPAAGPGAGHGSRGGARDATAALASLADGGAVAGEPLPFSVGYVLPPRHDGPPVERGGHRAGAGGGEAGERVAAALRGALLRPRLFHQAELFRRPRCRAGVSAAAATGAPGICFRAERAGDRGPGGGRASGAWRARRSGWT